MSKHTPGPWMVNLDIAQVDTLPSNVPICRLLWPTEVRSEEETYANAKLIAAAPDLLGALTDLEREISSRFGGDRDMSVDLQCVMLPARAAIAKATG